MNKQEALKKLKEASKGGCLKWVVYDDVKKLIEQIDEPEKPVIPQFVAEHIEYHKSMNSPMGDIFNRHFIDDKRVEVWLREALNAYDNLGKAWLFGYEVEKEKRYEVKLKNTDDYLVKTNDSNYHFYSNIYTQNRKHTRKELEEDGFGWVFDCEGVEVQEVE